MRPIRISPMVYLNSPGGAIAPAMAIGRMLRKERAWLVVARDRADPPAICASACILILAGAVSRTYTSGAIAIHRPYLEVQRQVVSADEVSKAYAQMLQEVQSYLKEMNVSERLADAMLSVPPQRIRYLTTSEAEAFGLLKDDPVYEEATDLQQA